MKRIFRQWMNWLPASARLMVETGVLLVLQRYLFLLKADRPRLSATLQGKLQQDLLRQVATRGFAIVPDFKSAEWCEQARAEVLRAMSSSDLTTRHVEDVRVFGIESLSPAAREFASDPMLHALACKYAASSEILLFCMANRVEYRDGAAHGSGGEWHRDSFKRELKAMLYLTDVQHTDGPLSIVSESHRLGRIAGDTARLAGRKKGDFISSVTATRLGDAGAYLGQGRQGRTVALTARQGSLLVFDGSTIHTGLLPEPGGAARLAFTNYYVTQRDAASIRAYYAPLVKLNS